MDDTKQAVRETVWTRLRTVARPDSRYHWDFGAFIPDFEGSERATERVVALPEYQEAHRIFVTPDNGLRLLREQVLRDGKALLVTTYGIARGFLGVLPGTVGEAKVEFAATMDGLDYIAEPLGIYEIVRDGDINLLVTGASAVSRDGVRLGKGHGYFDLEWAMLREVEVVGPLTPVVAVVHDCQLVEASVEAGDLDVSVDVIVTPEHTLRTVRRRLQPTGIAWDHIAPEIVSAIPPLQELRGIP